jgi:hypothetical protein
MASSLSIRLLDTLLTGISHFNESPEVLRRLASGDPPALCHVVT